MIDCTSSEPSEQRNAVDVNLLKALPHGENEAARYVREFQPVRCIS